MSDEQVCFASIALFLCASVQLPIRLRALLFRWEQCGTRWNVIFVLFNQLIYPYFFSSLSLPSFTFYVLTRWNSFDQIERASIFVREKLKFTHQWWPVRNSIFSKILFLFFFRANLCWFVFINIDCELSWLIIIIDFY